MICHFRRHLPEEDAEAWPAEAPADGGALLRVVERCSKPFRGRFPTNPLSTLAAFPAIRCRCGKRSYLIVPNCRDSRPDLPNSVRIYTLCRYILSFCIVQHTIRVYCIYCQLFKIHRLAGLRAFCHKTAFKAHIGPCPADAFLQNI